MFVEPDSNKTFGIQKINILQKQQTQSNLMAYVKCLAVHVVWNLCKIVN